MSRKAFMISINFIVILILALAVLGIGFSLSYRFLRKAETMKAQLDAQTEAQIESYLAAGEIVTIPITKKMISDGGAVFGLGVLNIQGNQDFTVKVECSQYYDVDGATSTIGCEKPPYDYTDWIKTTLSGWDSTGGTITLDSNEDATIAILITPQGTLSKGLYSFIVRVENGTPADYGDPQVIYVEVP